MSTKYTTEYTNISHFKTLQSLPKFGFFVLKIYHLATLIPGLAHKIFRRCQQGSNLLEIDYVTPNFIQHKAARLATTSKIGGEKNVKRSIFPIEI
jgi:hypothetical protein